MCYSQPLLSSEDESDEYWDEHKLKAELKYLKSYQRQEKELYNWLNDGHIRIVRTWAMAYKLDIDHLTVESIDKVPNMPEILRTMFLRAIEWCFLKERIEQLIKYQAQQKKEPCDKWPRWLHTHLVF